MTDKINIIVERDGEFHKFKFGSENNCVCCSLEMKSGLQYDACDICCALEGHFEKVVMKGDKMKNNNQIDNTSYYTLPSGKQLEDFIHINNLNFAEGSALKYLWRAGKKDGESKEKDLKKAEHYIRFIMRHTVNNERAVRNMLEHLIKEAKEY